MAAPAWVSDDVSCLRADAGFPAEVGTATEAVPLGEA